MYKKITIKVTEETYNRWKAAAERDVRTLNGWIFLRVEGKPEKVAENPQTPETIAGVESTVAEKPEPVVANTVDLHVLNTSPVLPPKRSLLFDATKKDSLKDS